MVLDVKRALRDAARFEKAGNLREAGALYTSILAEYPGNREARKRLSQLRSASASVAADPLLPLRELYRRRDFGRLIAEAQKLAPRLPGNPTLWSLVGAAEFELRRPAQAETAFRKALALAPQRPASHNNLGMALREQGKLDAAQKAFARALELNPDYADAHNNLGLIHQSAENWVGAEAAFARAAELNPADADAWTNLGNIRQRQGVTSGALDAYRRALAANPNHANAHYNMALALRRAGNVRDVVHHYREAVRCRPDFAMAHNNLGNALQTMGQLPAAEEALRRAVSLDPQSADAWNNLGIVMEKQGEAAEAIAAYDKALAIDPDFAMARAQKLHQMAQVCDWSASDELAEVLETLGTGDRAVMPLPLLAMEDNAARQCQRAKLYVREKFGEAAAAELLPTPERAGRKLRIGYFSADFRNHPVARLIAGTLAAHDYDRYDFYGYSFGPPSRDELRAEISERFTEFLDIRQSGDDEAYAAIRAHDLDIAVDLTGFTMHSRTQLFQRRLAPVQINYLGYPGTIGAEFMDYIVVDPVLVPAEQRAHLTESLIVMPHSYQPNDDRRPVPEDPGGRAAHGLPEDALVLCCFNNSYKISPREFDIWMRIMQQAGNTVLWLLKPSDMTAENLRLEAARRGVDPERIVFADRVENERHLARHRHADLFVDTFAYNAHTTASDALWMGLPVLTMAGEQFAARVGASLLTAVGMPDLITRSEAEYEAAILALVQAPERLAELRQRLDAGRAEAPLFDSEGYTRTLEAVFETVHRRWLDGEGPADIVMT